MMAASGHEYIVLEVSLMALHDKVTRIIGCSRAENAKNHLRCFAGHATMQQR